MSSYLSGVSVQATRMWHLPGRYDRIVTVATAVIVMCAIALGCYRDRALIRERFITYIQFPFLRLIGTNLSAVNEDGTTRATAAVARRDMAVLRALRCNGVDLSARDGSQRTPAEIAVDTDSPGSLIVLHRLGANLRDKAPDGTTLATRATVIDQQESVLPMMLTLYDIDPALVTTERDRNGNTAIMAALISCNLQSLEILYARNPKPLSVEDWIAIAPAMVATCEANPALWPQLQRIHRGLLPVRSQGRVTLAMIAAQRNNAALLKILYNIDPQLVLPLLTEAAHTTNEALIRTLYNIDPQLVLPLLTEAAHTTNEAVLRILNDIDPRILSIRDSTGNTPITAAVSTNNVTLLILLHRINPRLLYDTDVNRNTLAILAINNDHLDLLNELYHLDQDYYRNLSIPHRLRLTNAVTSHRDPRALISILHLLDPTLFSPTGALNDPALQAFLEGRIELYLVGLIQIGALP